MISRAAPEAPPSQQVTFTGVQLFSKKLCVLFIFHIWADIFLKIHRLTIQTLIEPPNGEIYIFPNGPLHTYRCRKYHFGLILTQNDFFLFLKVVSGNTTDSKIVPLCMSIVINCFTSHLHILLVNLSSITEFLEFLKAVSSDHSGFYWILSLF